MGVNFLWLLPAELGCCLEIVLIEGTNVIITILGGF